MLDKSSIKIESVPQSLKMSELVLRNIKGKTVDGDIVVEPELQFQVENISQQTLKDVDVEINYYTANGDFAGADTDLRLPPLKPGERHSFSLLVEQPEISTTAELILKATPMSLSDRIPLSIKLLFILILIAALVYVKLD